MREDLFLSLTLVLESQLSIALLLLLCASCMFITHRYSTVDALPQPSHGHIRRQLFCFEGAQGHRKASRLHFKSSKPIQIALLIGMEWL
jgi:hypothetical protein